MVGDGRGGRSEKLDTKSHKENETWKPSWSCLLKLLSSNVYAVPSKTSSSPFSSKMFLIRPEGPTIISRNMAQEDKPNLTVSVWVWQVPAMWLGIWKVYFLEKTRISAIAVKLGTDTDVSFFYASGVNGWLWARIWRVPTQTLLSLYLCSLPDLVLSPGVSWCYIHLDPRFYFDIKWGIWRLDVLSIERFL